MASARAPPFQPEVMHVDELVALQTFKLKPKLHTAPRLAKISKIQVTQAEVPAFLPTAVATMTTNISNTVSMSNSPMKTMPLQQHQMR